MYSQNGIPEEGKIAFFSMEVGLNDEMHTYSGGLGILAGDTIRSSADLGLPIIAVTLISKRGYFRQEISREGVQLEYPDPWQPSRYMTLMAEKISVQIQGRDVGVKAWLYKLKSLTGGAVPILFLDTDVEGNTDDDRDITSHLYGGDERYRLKQEVVLGIGGVRMLDALGFKIRKYHMNEGHSSLLAAELLRRRGMNVEAVRDLCVFTTHTPVDAAHDRFSYRMVKDTIGEAIPFEDLRRWGGQECLNMTLLALNLSKYHNGVTKTHSEISKHMFPGYEIHSITNGVHSHTWTCQSFKLLYNGYIPGWANEPELFVRVENIPDDEIWRAHREAKSDLIDYVNKLTGIELDGEALTIGFARRATGYKRLNLLFSKLEKLKEVGKRHRIQLIFAGKSHPKDFWGKNVIREVFEHIHELKGIVEVAYLKNYGLEMASKMVSGVDVWLNTPLPPLEASGTSGMKAAHNGVINFSVLDGWWVEGCIEGVTGWAIGPPPGEEVPREERRREELDDLYNKLEYVIAPMFYERRDEWIGMMKNSIGKIAYYFNSHRMMRRYVTEAYF